MAFSEAIPEYAAITDGSCTEAGVTQARLLTTSVKNGAANSYMDYEVAHSDCDGFALEFKNGAMKFDINAYVSKTSDIRYSINDGTLVHEGTLSVVNGEDLFGNKGSNKFYYSTQSVNFAGRTKKFTLRIFISGVTYSLNQSGIPTGDEKIDTFLRFGAASPVQRMINFIK